MNNTYRPYAELLSTRDRRRIRWEVIRGIASCLIILAIVVLMLLLAGTVPGTIGR